jgi:hypothetical protein
VPGTGWIEFLSYLKTRHILYAGKEPDRSALQEFAGFLEMGYDCTFLSGALFGCFSDIPFSVFG